MNTISKPRAISSALITLAFASAFGVHTYEYETRFGDTEEEIRLAESEILRYVASITEVIRITDTNEPSDQLYRLSLPHWPLSSFEFSSLNYQNKQKAESIILSAYRKPPASLDTFEKWKNRKSDAMQEWDITDSSAALMKALRIGGLAVAALPLVYFVLLILGWLWYFLLKRIAEMINALKGKEA